MGWFRERPNSLRHLIITQPGMFSLRLFGGAFLEGPDGALPGRATQRHRVALLALLATAGNGGVSRDKLIAYVWPELDTEQARHLLSNCLYVLRQALGETTLARSTDAVRLDPTRLRCGVRQFEEALARRDFGGVVAVYSGPFLDGFFLSGNPEFEQWMERVRGHLAYAHLRTIEALAEAAEGERSFPGAAESGSRFSGRSTSGEARCSSTARQSRCRVPPMRAATSSGRQARFAHVDTAVKTAREAGASPADCARQRDAGGSPRATRCA